MLSWCIKALHKLFAPPFCAQCRIFLEERTPLCVDCLATLKKVVSKTLPLSGNKQIIVHALGEYADPLITFIRAKNRGTPAGSRQLAELMFSSGMLDSLDFDIIVPVPMHWTKRIRRGFNQAEEIASYLAKKTGKPSLSLLVKKRKTADQASLKKEERLTNLRNAFQVSNFFNHKNRADKKILLVDDVMTTGSTLIFCAEALRQYNPALITALVGARVT